MVSSKTISQKSVLKKNLGSDGFIVVYSKDEPDSLAKVVEIVADINKRKEAAVVMVLENSLIVKGITVIKSELKTLIYDIEENGNTDQQNKKQVKSRFLQKIF